MNILFFLTVLIATGNHHAYIGIYENIIICNLFINKSLLDKEIIDKIKLVMHNTNSNKYNEISISTQKTDYYKDEAKKKFKIDLNEDWNVYHVKLERHVYNALHSNLLLKIGNAYLHIFLFTTNIKQNNKSNYIDIKPSIIQVCVFINEIESLLEEAINNFNKCNAELDQKKHQMLEKESKILNYRMKGYIGANKGKKVKLTLFMDTDKITTTLRKLKSDITSFMNNVKQYQLILTEEAQMAAEEEQERVAAEEKERETLYNDIINTIKKAIDGWREKMGSFLAEDENVRESTSGTNGPKIIVFKSEKDAVEAAIRVAKNAKDIVESLLQETDNTFKKHLNMLTTKLKLQDEVAKNTVKATNDLKESTCLGPVEYKKDKTSLITGIREANALQAKKATEEAIKKFQEYIEEIRCIKGDIVSKINENGTQQCCFEDDFISLHAPPYSHENSDESSEKNVSVNQSDSNEDQKEDNMYGVIILIAVISVAIVAVCSAYLLKQSYN